MVLHLMYTAIWTLPMVAGLFSRKGSTNPLTFITDGTSMNKALETWPVSSGSVYANYINWPNKEAGFFT